MNNFQNKKDSLYFFSIWFGCREIDSPVCGTKRSPIPDQPDEPWTEKLPGKFYDQKVKNIGEYTGVSVSVLLPLPRPTPSVIHLAYNFYPYKILKKKTVKWLFLSFLAS